VRSGSPRLNLRIISAAIGFPLLFGGAQQVRSFAPAAGDVPAAAAVGAPIFRAAAEAMRRRDCSAAMQDLAPLIGGQGPDRNLAALIAGFYAHACEQVAQSEDDLFAARMPGGAFEDWRLLLLADSARARGHVLVAKAALAKLLGDYPASPLRPRGMERAALLDWDQNDSAGALALIRQARKEGLHGEARTHLDSLAWDIGTRLGDPKVRTEAARELLVTSPLVAAQLDVVAVFRRPDGTFSWNDALSAAQLKQRAQTLLAAQLEPNALAALDAVAPGDRDLDWVLQKADALTRGHRGADALTLLRPLQGGDFRQAAAASVPERAEREMQPPLKGQRMAALEWALARASDDAALAHHGKSAAAQSERRKLRLAARLHLHSVVELGADPELTAHALRALYAHLIEEDLFDPAVEALRKLRALEPADTTGASLLWSRGWQEFIHRNYTGAIGYWSELTSLYPDDSSGRRARYWIARSYEVLADPDRARQMYAELAAADTSDFYRRNALLRLARWKAAPAATATGAAAGGGAAPAEPWPNDPVLVRAQLLSDFGLDDLAQSEIDLVRERAQPRAVAALQALVLARRGERRKSVLAIHDAFPALGSSLQASVPEEALKLYYPLDFEQAIRVAANANGLPPALVFAVIRQESAFDANARSWAGARGLMQLMPGTARELARGLGLGWSSERLADPAFNVLVGSSYLRQVLAMFDGNVELALAGYNGGPYRIKRLWRDAGRSDLDRFLEGLSIEESKIYVKRILVLSDSYRRIYPSAG
jgi:soluble lytic murein transglycosylase-like protein